MRSIVGFAATLGLLAGSSALAVLDDGSAAAQTAPRSSNPLYVVEPEWTSKPTGNDVARVAPPFSASTRMICHINGQGQLTPCATLTEAPIGKRVGEAGLKLAEKFRMKPLDAAGEAVIGRLIVLPIVFPVPGQPYPRAPGTLGDSVMVDLSSTQAAARIACPSAENSKRQCGLRELVLTTQAKTLEIGQAIAAIDKTQGASRTVCQVGQARDLRDCTPPQGLTSQQIQAFNALMALLRAPEKTVDGKPVAGQIVTDFDWREVTTQSRVRMEAEATATPASH